MADRPILFSAPMIRALIEGRKTQTRRIAKDVPPMPEQNCHPHNQKKHAAPYLDSYCSERKTAENPRGMSRVWNWWQVDNRCCLPSFKVLAQPGDRLWVRETWAPVGALTHNDPGALALAEGGFYRADQSTIEGEIIRWHSSIHMPRWASRLTLIVTDVRVQRLQEISEADAVAEGVVRDTDGWTDYLMPATQCCQSAVKSYATLWDHINSPDTWETNPWIVAYSFSVHRCNIDQMEAVHADTV